MFVCGGQRMLNVSTAERYMTKGVMKRAARPGERHIDTDDYEKIEGLGFGR